MKHLMNRIPTAALISAMPTAFANDGTKPRVEPVFTSIAATGIVPMPERKSKRGSTSIYPFASLTAIGMCFGVKNKNATSLSSVISNANRKAIVAKTNPDGTKVFKTTEIKDANGIVVGHAPTTEPETVVTAKYFAVDVDAAMKAKIKGTELEGSTALVFREV